MVWIASSAPSGISSAAALNRAELNEPRRKLPDNPIIFMDEPCALLRTLYPLYIKASNFCSEIRSVQRLHRRREDFAKEDVFRARGRCSTTAS
jgi:hypothetical protein